MAGRREPQDVTRVLTEEEVITYLQLIGCFVLLQCVVVGVVVVIVLYEGPRMHVVRHTAALDGQALGEILFGSFPLHPHLVLPVVFVAGHDVVIQHVVSTVSTRRGSAAKKKEQF
ncbi:hypothetical protein NPIL_5811 [Nephila pilipes]|uniref:Uncharacterized protein n=1 Tax=Nephila pilipes TaxID=299642 RepID=A0A8X6TK69_NEPPI|nr:hypothetical protein NPIL_5811 [Nephila pilipes]